MSEAISMHKRIAMGEAGAETHLKKGGKIAKYAKGGSVTKAPAEISQQPNVNKIGAVKESKASTLINDSSQKRPFDNKIGKIATMKKGGHAKGGLTIAIMAPMKVKKSAGRGR